MATQPSHPSPPRLSLTELTISEANSDLLDIEPLDLGPGAPASAALALERGPQPDSRERGRR